MADKKVKSGRRLTTTNTLTNAISFLVEQKIREKVNTAEIVRVDLADEQGTSSTGGRAQATPLVTEVDNFNEAVQPVALHSLPFYRPQAGKAAILMQPQPGDKAIAVFSKADSSGLTVGGNEPVKPGSFREFDQADGFLISGILGETPEIWLSLDPVSGEIELSTKAANVTVSARESGDIVVKTGQGDVTIQAGSGGEGTITLDGQVVVTRNIIVQNKWDEGQSQMTGGFNNTGGRITSNTVTLETHTHTGVQTGGGSTGSPNGGT